jgi:hypothetical protein
LRLFASATEWNASLQLTVYSDAFGEAVKNFLFDQTLEPQG